MPRPIIYRTIEEIRARCQEGEGDCWIWQGACDGHGRPQIRHGGKAMPVRRVVAGLRQGKEVAPYLVVAAKCQNLMCVSPDCAHITTTRGAAKMAAERGAYHSPAKTAKMAATKRAKSRISESLIEEIRASQESCYVLAARIGVSASHIKMIRRFQARRPSNNPFAGLFTRMAA